MYAAKTFAATGTSASISARTVLVGVTGSFTATVKIKWKDASGVAHTVQDSGADLAFTAAGEKVVDFGVPVEVYAECTAYTTGSPVVSLSGSLTGLEQTVTG